MAEANASEPEKVLRFVNELDQSAAQAGVVIADTIHRLLLRADRAFDLEVAIAEGLAARAVLHRVQVLAGPGPIVVSEALHDHHRAAENGLEIGGRERVVGVGVARLAQLRGKFPAAGPRVGDVDVAAKLKALASNALPVLPHIDGGSQNGEAWYRGSVTGFKEQKITTSYCDTLLQAGQGCKVVPDPRGGQKSSFLERSQ